MKKATTLLLLAAAIMGGLQAQTGDTLSQNQSQRQYPRLALGFTAGWDNNYHSIDMAYMTDIVYDKSAPGKTAGISARCYLTKWFALRADVAWITKNYNMNHVYKYYSLRYVTSTNTVNDYLTVPVVAQFSAGKIVRANAFFGGYAGYWLRSHRSGSSYSATYMMYSDESHNEYSEDMEFNEVRDNRFDAGLTWGAGLSGIIAKHFEVGAEIRWYYGLTDIQKNYMTNLNPRYNTTFVIQGGLNYWF